MTPAAVLKSGPKMFRLRVIEGQRRQTEWRGHLKALHSEFPDLSQTEIAKRARKAMGYEGFAKERVHYIEWLEKKNGNEAQRERRSKDKRKTFEYALSQLPDRGDPQEAIRWIQAHPAMSRKARLKTEEVVLLDAEDILSPPHGRAPSRYAATSLQTWVNRPDDFFKIVLNEQKKNAVKDDTIKDVAAELSIKEMEEMISSLGG